MADYFKEKDFGLSEFPVSPERFFKKALIFSSSDGYGLCLGVALEEYLNSHGLAVGLKVAFPQHSPRYFWTGETPTLLTKEVLRSESGVTFVIGIPFNNWTSETFAESLANCRKIVAGKKKAAGAPELVLINKRYQQDFLKFD